MKIHHKKLFKVRYYECDAFGFMRSSQYLRWMQETAFAASAAVGYDFARYEVIGSLWLVRETDIKYLVPLRAGDEVELTTWVIDFRRFRSRRAYEFRHQPTGRLAARAATDWVYLDAKTRRPHLIPPAMQAAFLPEGGSDAGIRRRRFTKSPVPETGHASQRVQVEWSEIDTMWHVNNANYLRYIENTDAHLGPALGWPVQPSLEQGWRIETTEHHIAYRQPARLGDELEIMTWCSDWNEETMHQHYEIRRIGDGNLLAQARALRRFVAV